LSRLPFVCRRVLTLLAFALGTHRAECQPKLVVDLDYGADAALEACPSEAAFRAQIRSQLGYDPFLASSAHKVVARAAADAHGIRGFVRWYDASGKLRGERELRSSNEDCAAFARAMSFAIAVQIQILREEAEQPVAGASRAASDTDGKGETFEKSEPASSTNLARRSERPPSRTSPFNSNAEPGKAPPWQLMIGAGPGVRFGVGPRPAAEGRVFALVRRDPFAVQLGADASLPSRNPTAEGEGFELNLAGASVSGCAFVQLVSVCLVNRLGRVAVRGFGVDMPRSSSRLVADFGPRLALQGTFARGWMGVLRIETLVALSPWRVTLREREVWRAPPLSLSIGVDLVAVFNDNP
jgi:hypothetical protein